MANDTPTTEKNKGHRAKNLSLHDGFGGFGGSGRLMTVGFLCGPGAETLIFVTGTSGKYRQFSSPGRKTKVSCGYPENQEK